MRPLLPGELDTITAPAVAQHTRVEVQDAAGVWRDWSAYVSLDGTACGEDREQGVGSAVIALHRGLGASSLVPLVTTSGPNTVGGGYAPAVDIGRGVRISTATTAPGVTPTTEWREIFRGRVNGVAWESDPITLSCSDLGAWLMDAQIETASRYDFAGGAAREYVMQQVIDAAPLGVTPPTLVTPASPLSYLTKWDQPPAKLLDALRTLAGGIGWDVRYRYDASHTPQLTFYDPDRERVDTDATFPDTRYLAIQRLSVSLANVRNAGRVWYGDGAEDYVEGAVAPGVFRRRWFQIPKQEGIDTAEEAERLLAAALHDLSGADVELSVTLRHFWPVQLFDRYLIGANADTHDAGQVLAVSGYRHTWQNGVIYTTLTGASRVVGAYADWIRRGRGAPTTAEPEILELTFEDTTDGVGVTTRTYTIRANGATRTVWAYDRLRPPGSGDPWPSDAELPDGLPPVLTLDADGVTTYTTPVPPPGYQRFLQFEPRTAAGQEGEVRRATIDPAAPATSGSVSALVTNDTADLTVRVTGGPGSWPVAWFLYEDDPAGLPLASGTATADTSLTKLSPGLAVLGARPLPLREVRRWFLKLLDANGLTAWGASASADRDALPEGTVTPRDYRADAELAVAYDDDTDSVRVTVPGGKTKTWAGLSGSGTVVYAVGDPLDDATTEGALALDETREGYTVEIQGGGTWVPKFDGALHGPPSSPPTVRPRFVLSADRDAADVFVTVDSSADEAIRLWVRDSDSSSAPEYGLVAGAGSTVALYVTRGTELGPAHFFRASSGSAAAKFSGIPLVRDQVRTIYVQAEGEQSLVRSAWVPVPLGTKEQPYLESLEATWDAAAGELRVTARGGAHSASVMIEADDAAAFSSSLAPAYADRKSVV